MEKPYRISYGFDFLYSISVFTDLLFNEKSVPLLLKVEFKTKQFQGIFSGQLKTGNPFEIKTKTLQIGFGNFSDAICIQTVQYFPVLFHGYGNLPLR